MTEPSYPRLHDAFRDLADEAAPCRAPAASRTANFPPGARGVAGVTCAAGALRVAGLPADRAGRVLRGDVEGGLFEPVWARDSARLLIRDTSTGKVGTVDVAH